MTDDRNSMKHEIENCKTKENNPKTIKTHI